MTVSLHTALNDLLDRTPGALTASITWQQGDKRLTLTTERAPGAVPSTEPAPVSQSPECPTPDPVPEPEATSGDLLAMEQQLANLMSWDGRLRKSKEVTTNGDQDKPE
jgi:hypothetical protein